MTEIADSEFPALFAHGTRKDWGVGVLAEVRDGKRTYIFESGEVRVMGSGAHDLMRQLTGLDDDQRSTLARLTALVARRRGRPDVSKSTGTLLLGQLADLRRTFPQGLADAAWPKRAAQARETLVPRAQALLSRPALDAALHAQRFDEVWASASQILAATGWLPAAHPNLVPALGLGLLAGAVRELLYGSAAIEQRIDRFLVAFETAFQRAPSWEATTALLALVHPSEHVLVDLPSFRRQLKLLGSKGPLPQRPKGVGYVRCLNAARIVSSKLSELGETPGDLLDVHDIIRFTLKTNPPARRLKAPQKKPARVDAAADDASD
jgi:hypothetical protein